MSCWPWSHQWSKWIVVNSGRVREPKSHLLGEIEPVEEWIEVGTFEEQRRVCEKCGKSQLREVRT